MNFKNLHNLIFQEKICLGQLGIDNFSGIPHVLHPLVTALTGVQRRMISVDNFFVFLRLLIFAVLLAHLSQRLIGELIVYEGIRRPSVVCQHFQTTSPLKP